MNYMARALASAIALGTLGALHAPNEAVAGDQFPDWGTAWKKVGGYGQVVDEAHIRMAGTVLRIVGIARLDDPEQARIAKEGTASLIQGKKLYCEWLPGPAREGNPMAVSPEGFPLVSCLIRDLSYAPCKDPNCVLSHRMVRYGYGIPEGGAWEQRSPAASRSMARRATLAADARRQKIGIWAE